MLEVIPKRFGRFGLSIHPEKTKLVSFSRPGGNKRKVGKTFDYLGFTHYWGKSRKGYWVIKRKTARKSFNKALKRIAEWCRKNRHLPIAVQQTKLHQKLNGHFAYYGITGNARWLHRYRDRTKRYWRKWLNRREGKSSMTWERFELLLQYYPLPRSRVVHSIYAAKP